MGWDGAESTCSVTMSHGTCDTETVIHGTFVTTGSAQLWEQSDLLLSDCFASPVFPNKDCEIDFLHTGRPKYAEMFCAMRGVSLSVFLMPIFPIIH